MNKPHLFTLNSNDTYMSCPFLSLGLSTARSNPLYTSKTYEWLFQHTLNDPMRPVNTTIDITQSDLSNAYREFQRRTDQLERELDNER